MDREATPEPSPRGGSLRWNSTQEAAAQKIGECSRAFKTMHITVARFTSKMYEVLMITSIVLGPAAGTIDVVGSAYPENVDTFLLVSAVLSFLCGILLTIVKFSALEEESAAHRTAAVKYTSLESNVRRQMALYRDNRPDPDKYLEWITTSYDELFASAPLIPRRVQDAYATHAREHGIQIPDQIEDVIEINTDYQESKTKEITNTDEIHVTSRNSVSKVDLERGESPGSTDTPVLADVSIKSETGNSKTLKRTKTMEHYADMGTFGDGLMNYEMKRMLGFDK